MFEKLCLLEVESGITFEVENGLEIKFRDCLSVNLDDLSTFLQLSSELCRKGRDGSKSQVKFRAQHVTLNKLVTTPVVQNSRLRIFPKMSAPR